MLSLDDLIADLSVQDRMQHIIWSVRQQMPEFFAPEPAVRKVADEKREERISELAEEFIETHVPSIAPAIHYSSATEFVPKAFYDNPSTVSYRKADEFYVHVPSWVKVHRAPFHHFGSSLFGLAYTATGDVHIREDLDGMHFTEVLQHEVFHQLYPNCSEQQVRQMVLARFGSSAEIHSHICRP